MALALIHRIRYRGKVIVVRPDGWNFTAEERGLFRVVAAPGASVAELLDDLNLPDGLDQDGADPEIDLDALEALDPPSRGDAIVTVDRTQLRTVRQRGR